MGAGAGTELKDNRQKSAAQSREPLDLSFRERAVTFSIAAGCVVFILAMLVGAATTHGGGPREFRNALILGIICGVTSWGATMRIVRVRAARSEEHTSELQSLMRISSAVFCLKKKNYTHTI